MWCEIVIFIVIVGKFEAVISLPRTQFLVVNDELAEEEEGTFFHSKRSWGFLVPMS